MSFTDMLEELPRLTFEERQHLVRRAIELDDEGLSPEEKALLDQRLADFHRDPEAGIPLADLKGRVLDRLRGR